MPESASDPHDSATPDVTTRAQLDELRVEFGRTIKSYFPTLFVLTVVIAVSLVVLIGVGFAFGKTMEATVLAASVQVAFGMVLGFVCVYIGLMMTWVGIDAAYTFRGGVGSGSMALQSASPGLLFALGGMILVAVSLYKRIEYQENTSRLIDTQSIDAASGLGGVTPIAPKSMKLTSPGSNRSEPPAVSGDSPDSVAPAANQAPPNRAPASVPEPNRN